MTSSLIDKAPVESDIFPVTTKLPSTLALPKTSTLKSVVAALPIPICCSPLNVAISISPVSVRPNSCHV